MLLMYEDNPIMPEVHRWRVKLKPFIETDEAFDLIKSFISKRGLTEFAEVTLDINHTQKKTIYIRCTRRVARVFTTCAGILCLTKENVQ